jgi:hypothetical protein
MNFIITFFSFFGCYCSLVALSTVNQGEVSFLILGDWGKGGSSGKYSSSIGIYNESDIADKFPEESEALIMPSEGEDADFMSPLAATSYKSHNSFDVQASATYQIEIAAAMGNFASNRAMMNRAPSFLVAVGDNFYKNGVSSSTDSLWYYLWEDVYISRYSALKIPWYPVLGNHDYGGGRSYAYAQIQRYLDRGQEGYWEMSSTNYSHTFEFECLDETDGRTKKGSVTIIFIDTTTLAPSVNKCCNENG